MKEYTFERLQSEIAKIRSMDQNVYELSYQKWNTIAKPLHSLGKLERHVMQIAAITGDIHVNIDKKALIAMCADNGVVAEGVTQSGQEVTAIVAENFLKGDTSVAIMCKKAGVDLFPIDIGMAVDTKVPSYKVRYGTANMAKEPAMTYEEAVEAILKGVDIVKEKKKEGYRIIATGEMGIGNTTTSSAIVSVLLDQPVEKMTGRGAGLASAGLRKKIQVIEQAIEDHKPNPADPIDVISKVGGLDIAGLVGVYLGCAICRIPVVIDGFISAAAALAAKGICSDAKDYMIASHVSKEPAAQLVLQALEVDPSLYCEMCLGEGTGAVAFLPVLDMGVEVYEKMSSFEEASIEAYQELV